MVGVGSPTCFRPLAVFPPRAIALGVFGPICTALFAARFAAAVSTVLHLVLTVLTDTAPVSVFLVLR